MKLVQGLFIMALFSSQALCEQATAVRAATSDVKIVTYIENEILCPCDLTYKPICGTDGHTYSNDCVLKCIRKDNERRGGATVGVAHDGPCPTPNCYCSTVYQPVCGSNNQSYTNECFLLCENSWREIHKLSLISIAYHEACHVVDCVCPDDIKPVCGTDSKTYKNICYMHCYSNQVTHKQPMIKVNYDGECKTENCECSNVIDEVCSNNQKLYPNECIFTCENRKRHQLGLPLYKITENSKCLKCLCPGDYSPVCGNNDVTYANLCQFQCEIAKRKLRGEKVLEMRWKGDCSCGCSTEWQPVCGSDHRTYANHCLLGCENRKAYQDGNPDIHTMRAGECNQCKDCDFCTTRLAPVCGNDHRTYWNSCYLYCNSDCRVAVGRSRLWIEKKGEC